MSTTDNPQCPDFSSHEQNAYDQWAERSGHAPQTSDDFGDIDAMAEREYRECEGHG